MHRPALGSTELFGEREVCAVSPHARDDVVDVVDGEHDAA
jgi:hypothetical protein